MASCTEAEKTIAGRPIECVLLPGGYPHAARVLLAGTSWGFDLHGTGATLNRPAWHCSWNERRERWVGLRGALAWPPLFLLNAVSFWSRYLTIYQGRCRHNHAVAFLDLAWAVALGKEVSVPDTKTPTAGASQEPRPVRPSSPARTPAKGIGNNTRQIGSQGRIFQGSD